ncbi:ATP-binding cassette domain-containing protein [Serratia ureilytica]
MFAPWIGYPSTFRTGILLHARAVRLGQNHLPRLIAGFEQLTSGSIRIHGRSRQPAAVPARREYGVSGLRAVPAHVGAGNVAYGLMVKGVAKRERLARAQEALESVALGFVAERKPAHLSGGQRQRVALARAGQSAAVLLLDEPLGALDLKLREQMQGELKKLQRQLASPLSSSPTIKAKRCRCPIGWRCSITAASNRWIRRASFTCGLRRRSSPESSAPPTWCAASWRSACSAKAEPSPAEHIRLLEQGGAAQDEIGCRARCGNPLPGAATRYEIALNDGESCWSARPIRSGSPKGNSGEIGQPIVACWPRAAMVPLLEER